MALVTGWRSPAGVWVEMPAGAHGRSNQGASSKAITDTSGGTGEPYRGSGKNGTATRHPQPMIDSAQTSS
jgi:hypothetical protein